MLTNRKISASFVELCAPATNYGMKGQLALFINPIMHLTDEQRFVCERDFRWIEYRRHREVTYYADALCVTPKYLSEVSKRVSGYAANYWINRYTSLDIGRLLKDKTLTFVQISDMFHFSSPAYFSRYVQRTLSMNPSRYRE